MTIGSIPAAAARWTSKGGASSLRGRWIRARARESDWCVVFVNGYNISRLGSFFAYHNRPTTIHQFPFAVLPDASSYRGRYIITAQGSCPGIRTKTTRHMAMFLRSVPKMPPAQIATVTVWRWHSNPGSTYKHNQFHWRYNWSLLSEQGNCQIIL